MTGGQVVSFDLDGTLIQGPFARVIKDLESQLADAGVTTRRGEIMRRHKKLARTDLLAAYDWDSIITEYLAELGTDPPFDLMERLDQHAADGGTRLIHAGTAGHLHTLRTAGWRVVVLTNGWYRYQQSALRPSGLLPEVDDLITSDQVGAPKPAAAMFEAAQHNAAGYVHVGDRMDHDIVAANAYGAQTVLMRTDVPRTGPTADAAPSSETMSYLQQLAAAQQAALPQKPKLLLPDLLAADLGQLVDWLLTPA